MSMSDEQQRLLDALRQGRVAPVNFTSFARLLRADESADESDDEDDGDVNDGDDDYGDDDYGDDYDHSCECCGAFLGRSWSSLCGVCRKYEVFEPAQSPAAPAAPADGDDDGSDYW